MGESHSQSMKRSDVKYNSFHKHLNSQMSSYCELDIGPAKNEIINKVFRSPSVSAKPSETYEVH